MLSNVGELTPILMIGLGFVIGLEHAFEPDHVSAVSTQISKRKFVKKSANHILKLGFTNSSIVGIIWGAGHVTTLVFMGLLIYTFAITIPSGLFSSFELTVGIMLIVLGITTIFKRNFFKHRHPHKHHNGTIHFETHDHTNKEHRHNHKYFIIGLVHGLAGSGSLVVLTASTLGNVETVMSFILIFGAGSILGMAVISGLVGIPFALTKNGSVSRVFRYLAGTISFIIGISIVYEITIIDNLFVI